MLLDKFSENLPDALSKDYNILDTLSNYYDVLDKLSNDFNILYKLSNAYNLSNDYDIGIELNCKWEHIFNIH